MATPMANVICLRRILQKSLKMCCSVASGTSHSSNIYKHHVLQSLLSSTFARKNSSASTNINQNQEEGAETNISNMLMQNDKSSLENIDSDVSSASKYILDQKHVCPEKFPTYFVHSEENMKMEKAVEDKEVWKEKGIKPPDLYRQVFPEFLPNPDRRYRHFLLEKVERRDMLRRRSKLDIPEFYVGSIIRVISSDPAAAGRISDFMGICIQRVQHGLRHKFTLRNHIDGEGVEITYDMYNPIIRRIEVIRLRRAPDHHMIYLRDAPPEHSTFDFDMKPVPHPPGTPVPVIDEKVPLNPPPWYAKWYGFDLEGVDYNTVWPHVHPKMARKWLMRGDDLPFDKYDLMKQYRKTIPKEDQEVIYSDVHEQMLRTDEEKKAQAVKTKSKSKMKKKVKIP